MFALKEAISGLIIMSFALAFGVPSYFNYALGTVARMGPGFFPLALAVITFGIGLAVLIAAWPMAKDKRGSASSEGFRDHAKAIVVVALAVLAFILLLEGAGLAPAVFMMSVIILAVISGSWKETLIASALISAGCVGIFHYGLGASLPPFGSWIN